MSLHVYSGPRPSRRSTVASSWGWLPWARAAATVGLQIAWPLMDTVPGVGGDARDRITVAVVIVFFLATTSYVLVHRGRAVTAAYLGITLGIGLGAEVLGTRTGFPFGDYSYGDGLGPSVLGVPVVVPLAWAMMAYPALAAARLLTRSSVLAPLVGMLALASWDLFLDPQMTWDGHWSFADPTPGLPGLEGIPLTNYAGWLVTSLVMMVLLDRLPRHGVGPEAQPAFLYLWTWVGGIVANAVFLERPAVALWGGAVMGLVAVPYAWALWSNRA